MAKPKKSAAAFLESERGELTLGRYLRAIRVGEEATQAAFAEMLGVSKAHLCDVEKERRTVSPARAAKWAELLGYPVAQFVALALQGELDAAGLKLRVHVDAA